MPLLDRLARTRRRLPFLDPMTGADAPASDDRVLSPDASSAHWEPLGYRSFPLRDTTAPDRRTAIMPSAIGRGYAGLQLLNGVGQLSSRYLTPVKADGSSDPYHQVRPVQNPTLAQRLGGRAQQAPGAITSQDWHDQMYSGVPATGNGPGTIAVSLSSAVRKRMGWRL